MSRAVAFLLCMALAAPAGAEPAASPNAGLADRAPAAGVEPAPFGPGASLEVSSAAEPVTVYVAKLEPTVGGELPDSAFVKVGRTPISLQLPPGTYRVEVEGPGISNTGMLVEMRGEPRRLLARPGSEGMAVTGTLLLATGIAGLLGATAILVSGSKAPSSFNKTSVLVPMYAASTVLLGAGIGMTIGGKTNLDEPQKPASPKPRGAVVSVGFRF